MSEYLDYRIELPEREVLLKYGRTLVSLCRIEEEYNYVAIEEDDGKPFRMFGSIALCNFVAGYATIWDEEDECWYRPTVYDTEDGLTFHEKTGWSPIIIEKDRPLEWEREAYIKAAASDIDGEWRGLGTT